MTGDFTYTMYARLLDTLVAMDRPCLTVRAYLTTPPDALPEGAVVLRHDIDRKPQNSCDFARLEADRGIASTYYVRTVPATFDPACIRTLAGLGHEVGYHYEDMDRANGVIEAAHDSFLTHLERVRALTPVETVCMHGNPLTPHDNRDMWSSGPPLTAYGLVGEAYLSMDFTDLHYYSDTGRTWRDGALKIKDHPVTESSKAIQVATTPDLIDLLRATPETRYCLLTHPDRWAGTPIERVAETTFDTVKNVAKYALTNAPIRR